MHRDDSIVRLLGILYAAPTDPLRWREFLDQLCELCNVSKAALIAHDLARDDHRILAAKGDEILSSGHLYEDYYWQFDQWTSSFCQSSKKGKVILGEEVWPKQELLKSVYFNEFLSKYDISQLLGSPFMAKPGVFESISLYRGPNEDSFGEEQLSVLKIINPHLEMALETRRKLLSLESKISDLENALNSLQSALILVDESGKVCFMNRMAERTIAQSDCLSIHNGRLIASRSQETSKIRATVEKAIALSKGDQSVECGVLPINRAGRRPVHVFITPASSNGLALPGRAAAFIFIDDLDLQPLVPADVLRTLFGLTPAETRLALSIHAGNSVSESAEHNGVGRETAKSQMSAILAKTGTRRQGELVKLLSRLRVQTLQNPNL